MKKLLILAEFHIDSIILKNFSLLLISLEIIKGFVSIISWCEINNWLIAILIL